MNEERELVTLKGRRGGGGGKTRDHTRKGQGGGKKWEKGRGNGVRAPHVLLCLVMPGVGVHHVAHRLLHEDHGIGVLVDVILISIGHLHPPEPALEPSKVLATTHHSCKAVRPRRHSNIANAGGSVTARIGASPVFPGNFL